MKDPQDSPVQGRTRWRRFAALIVPTAAVAGAIVFGMANGAIAASSPSPARPSRSPPSKLEGEGFVQYGGIAAEKNGTAHPVAVSGIKQA